MNLPIGHFTGGGGSLPLQEQVRQLTADLAAARDNLQARSDYLTICQSERQAAWEELAAARAQLPPTMQDCTIVFKECDLGHGWLTARNWVPFGCPTCELAAARAELALLRDQVTGANLCREADRRQLDAAQASGTDNCASGWRGCTRSRP
jgi:hypothetical protein